MPAPDNTEATRTLSAKGIQIRVKYQLPRCFRQGTFSNSFKNSIATLSLASENVTKLWITLLAGMSNVEVVAPNRVAGPKDKSDSWAASQSARRYGAFKVMMRVQQGLQLPGLT